MKKILISIFVNAVALWAAAWILGGGDMVDGVMGWIVLAIIFGLVNTFIKPIIKLFSLPLTVLTLGLFTLVINDAMLALTMLIAGMLHFETGFFKGIWSIFLAAIIISVVSAVLNWILPDGD